MGNAHKFEKSWRLCKSEVLGEAVLLGIEFCYSRAGSRMDSVLGTV